MHSPDLYMGLGSIVYALSKLDGHLQKEEIREVKELLAKEPYGKLALCAFFLRENTGETVEDAYAFGMRRMTAQRVELNAQTRKRFVTILLRVARAHKGISHKERSFIRAFWQEIHQL